MNARIMVHLQELEKVVKATPALQRIIDEDAQAEINPLLYGHIKDPVFSVGYDFLGLVRETAKIIEGKKYDKTKIRRRIEEHIRKYGTDQSIIALALFLGVPIN
jgi:hypothetical protein